MRGPRNRELALRDLALASAFGLVGNTNYGHEPKTSFGSEWGWDSDSPGYYGYHGGDDGFGFGFGADAAAMAPAAAAVPASNPMHPLHPAQRLRTMAIVDKANREAAITMRRESILQPNKGSKVDVERYDFSVSQALTLGTAATSFPSMTIQPAVTVRPQRCTFNAPVAGFATITSILVANVNALVGAQAVDAFIYGPQSYGVHLDLPTLNPANRLTISGSYGGLTPPGYPVGFSFLFTASFQGPATVVA